jgi:hypothetical protein
MIQKKILQTAVALLLISSVFSDITVKIPEELADKIVSASGKTGVIDYSISTFGFLDYQAQANYYVEYYSGGTGCTPIIKSSTESEEDNGDYATMNKAYIVKRGECEFYTKAKFAGKENAKLVIVVLDEHDDPKDIIPISTKDSNKDIFKNQFIFRNFFNLSSDSDVIPPLILIPFASGNKLLNYAWNNREKAVLFVDFDMVKNYLNE